MFNTDPIDMHRHTTFQDGGHDEASPEQGENRREDSGPSPARKTVAQARIVYPSSGSERARRVPRV
jgi:hypothetical protein